MKLRSFCSRVCKWVTIKWNIIVEKWAIIKSWTYIEWKVFIWKNSCVWPNAYLRWTTVIWENSKVWNAVEIKNSNLWDYTNVPHLSYLWDSIIWNHVNIWWGFIWANCRHDWANIRAISKWELVDTWRKKLWIIIWDNSKLWVKNCSYPWRTLETNSKTIPWEVIK